MYEVGGTQDENSDDGGICVFDSPDADQQQLRPRNSLTPLSDRFIQMPEFNQLKSLYRLVMPVRNTLFPGSWNEFITVCSQGPFIRTRGQTEVKCLELSHDQRLAQSILWVEQNKPKSWTWCTPTGDYTINYVELKPNHSTSQPSSSEKICVMVHGFTSHSYAWRFLASHLADFGYRVYCMDLLGHGQSDCPDNISYDVEIFVKQLESFMDAMKIERAHMFGHSLGGGIVTMLSLRYANRVISLNLFAPLLFPIDYSWFYPFLGTIGSVLPLLTRWMRLENLIRATLVDRNGVVMWTEYDLQQFAAPFQRPDGWRGILELISHFDNAKLQIMSECYSRIRVPVLYITGNDDDTIPVDHAFRLSEQCPHVDVHVIDNAGHFLLDETPISILNIVHEFCKNTNNKT